MEYDPAIILEELLRYVNLNSSQLAEKIGISAQSFYDIKSDKKKKRITKGLADRICKFYPEIDKVYLMTGEGSLLLNTQDLPNSRLYDILENFSRALLVSSETNRDREKINLFYAESFDRLTRSFEQLTTMFVESKNKEK